MTETEIKNIINLRLGTFQDYDDNNTYEDTRISAFGDVHFYDMEGLSDYVIDEYVSKIVERIEKMVPPNSLEFITDNKFSGLTDEQYDELTSEETWLAPVVKAIDNCMKKGLSPRTVLEYIGEKAHG